MIRGVGIIGRVKNFITNYISPQKVKRVPKKKSAQEWKHVHMDRYQLGRLAKHKTLNHLTKKSLQTVNASDMISPDIQLFPNGGIKNRETFFERFESIAPERWEACSSFVLLNISKNNPLTFIGNW